MSQAAYTFPSTLVQGYQLILFNSNYTFLAGAYQGFASVLSVSTDNTLSAAYLALQKSNPVTIVDQISFDETR